MKKNDYIRYIGQIITAFMKENRQNFVENRQKINEKIFVFKIPVNILYWKKNPGLCNFSLTDWDNISVINISAKVRIFWNICIPIQNVGIVHNHI